MKVTIPVTRKHIDTCVMRSTTHCCMAMAIGEAIPVAAHVTVGISDLNLYRHDDSIVVQKLPIEVENFIYTMCITKREDRCNIAERSFEVDIPDEFLPKEPIREVVVDAPEPEPTPPPRSSLLARVVSLLL